MNKIFEVVILKFNMAVKVLIYLSGKPESSEELQYLLEKMKQRMEMEEECTNVKIYQDTAKPHDYLLYEDWMTAEAHKTFLDGLVNDGSIDQLKETLTKPITRDFFDISDN